MKIVTPRQLQKELKVSYNDVYIYQNKDEATYGTYQDLWKSEQECEQLRHTGIASEDTRKVWSGDDSGDYDLAKNNNILSIKLRKVFEGYTPIHTREMADIKYLVTLPQSEEIMVAQTGETIGKYKITNINLEFESIIGKAITDATKAGYEKACDLYYP